MHELSVCEAIADTVLRHADGRGVSVVRLRIGHLRQIVPESLEFHWELRTTGTDLDGCHLEVDYIPVEIECRRCGTTTTLTYPILLCDACDSADVSVTRGEKFLVESIELADRGIDSGV